MNDFHFECTSSKHDDNSILSFTETDFNKNKIMLDFSNYSTKCKYYGNLNTLVAGKMPGEAVRLPILYLVDLKPKMYSFLVDYSSEYKK